MAGVWNMNTGHPMSDPTVLGTVEDVTGSRVSVKLADETAHGLLFVRGEGYRVGQVGSFVRIPAGYVDLFGIVAQVGAGAAPPPPDALRTGLPVVWSLCCGSVRRLHGFGCCRLSRPLVNPQIVYESRLSTSYSYVIEP